MLWKWPSTVTGMKRDLVQTSFVFPLSVKNVFQTCSWLFLQEFPLMLRFDWHFEMAAFHEKLLTCRIQLWYWDRLTLFCGWDLSKLNRTLHLNLIVLLSQDRALLPFFPPPKLGCFLCVLKLSWWIFTQHFLFCNCFNWHICIVILLFLLLRAYWLRQGFSLRDITNWEKLPDLQLMLQSINFFNYCNFFLLLI